MSFISRRLLRRGNTAEHHWRSDAVGGISGLAVSFCSEPIWATGSASGYRGVDWCTSACKWRARAQVHGKTKCLGFFATSEEAAITYDDHLRSHAAAASLVRRLNFPTPLEVRRSLADAPRSAEIGLRNSEVEALSRQLFEEHISSNDWELEWMYEGTRADGAFRPATTSVVDDGWVGLQMKAASKPISGTAAVYHFSRTQGYSGLLLCCMALDAHLLWTIPGDQVKVQGVEIRPGGKWDHHRCCWSKLDDALHHSWGQRNTFLRQPLSVLRLPSSSAQRIERRSLDVAAHALQQVGFHVAPPRVQHGLVDMILDGVLRIQCKARTSSRHPSTNSYVISLGRSSAKNRLTPYSIDDFDMLLVVIMDGIATLGFFVIPAWELERRGHMCHYLRRMSLSLYPPWSLPGVSKARSAKEWQAESWVSAEVASEEEKAQLRRLVLACRAGQSSSDAQTCVDSV